MERLTVWERQDETRSNLLGSFTRRSNNLREGLFFAIALAKADSREALEHADQADD